MASVRFSLRTNWQFLIPDCSQNDFNQRKSAGSAAKIFLLHATDNIKGKESWPLIAQISADKKSIAQGFVEINIKIILIANCNKMVSGKTRIPVHGTHNSPD